MSSISELAALASPAPTLLRTSEAWPAPPGRLTLKGYTTPVHPASFRPDGSRIVTACSDGTAKVWNATSGAEVLTLRKHNWESVAPAPHGPGKTEKLATRVTNRRGRFSQKWRHRRDDAPRGDEPRHATVLDRRWRSSRITTPLQQEVTDVPVSDRLPPS
jgi:WD40 repeat protein